jgi:hypothetical protein
VERLKNQLSRGSSDTEIRSTIVELALRCADCQRRGPEEWKSAAMQTHAALLNDDGYEGVVGGRGGGEMRPADVAAAAVGRGLHSFPFQLNLSNSRTHS